MPRWKDRTDFERVLEKISFGFGEDACWTWLGAIQTDGYGSVGIKKDGKWRMTLPHRFMYEECLGKIPEKMCVCHSCDNPACVNPKHLFLGTHKDNMLDKLNKGRVPDMTGENNPNAKLSKEDVLYIRSYFGVLNITELSRLFNVTPTNISDIVKNETWTHV